MLVYSPPRDLDESAVIDGASNTQVLACIMLPLLRPILAVIAILILQNQLIGGLSSGAVKG